MNDEVVTDEDLSPGWDAIDAALFPIYGDTQPLHWGTVIKYRLGGPDPLDGVSAYRRDAPVPHWHFISYGMSELYEKESDDPEVSGWGLEFTFRLACESDETQAPIWPVNFLQNLARYVYNTGNVFRSGHLMDLCGAISLENPETAIRAISFLQDPELPEMTTHNGKVQFLQIVGITPDEHQLIREWNTSAFLNLVSEKNPCFVTDLHRASLLESPDFFASAIEGKKADGSSTGFLYVDPLSWEADGSQFSITVGANTLQNWPGLCAGRLGFGRPLLIVGDGQQFLFNPSSVASVEIKEDQLVLGVTQELIEKLQANLGPKRGIHQFSFGDQSVTFKIIPSEITDADGNVVEVIG
jgi:suppressor of fused